MPVPARSSGRRVGLRVLLGAPMPVPARSSGRGVGLRMLLGFKLPELNYFEWECLQRLA